MLRAFLIFCLFNNLEASALTEAITAPAVNAPQAVLMDFASKTVLFEHNAHSPVPPSSMTKMMTIYLLFTDLAQGKVKLEDLYTVSTLAWKQGGSRMFLDPASRVSVEDLLKGATVSSGNDACVALAENISGSVERFVERMNDTAKRMNLKNTHFRNATGWPEPDHLSSVYDLAVIAWHTIHEFPELYEKYYNIPEFTYNKIHQQNRNQLYKVAQNVDGLKTGHSDSGGWGLAFSAKRGNQRVIGVVNGLANHTERIENSKILLEWGFQNFQSLPIYKKGDKVGELLVEESSPAKVPLFASQDLIIPIPKGTAYPQMRVNISLEKSSELLFPVQKGQAIAQIQVSDFIKGGNVVLPLTVDTDLYSANKFSRLWRKLQSTWSSTPSLPLASAILPLEKQFLEQVSLQRTRPF